MAPPPPVPQWPRSGRGREHLSCRKCARHIHDTAIEADGSAYHRECFTCDECCKKISGSYFFDRERGLRCEGCHVFHLPKCAGCGYKVREKSVVAEGGTYHPECFICKDCRRPINGSYHILQSGFRCTACTESHAPKCAKCGHKVLNKSVCAEGLTYHEGCFCCGMCRKQIVGSYFKDGDGKHTKHLCETCHAIKNPPKTCSACRGRIDGDGAVVGKEMFHSQCFSCYKCKQCIHGDYVKDKEGYLCNRCQPRCEACNGPLAGCTTINVKGKEYHQECFTCSTCGNCIRGGHYEAEWGLIRCQACQANFMQAQAETEESRHVASEKRLWRQNTDKFNLEWRPELVPCSREALKSIGLPFSQLPRGRYIGLCFNKKSGLVGCASLEPNCDPAVAINMSYLACALQIFDRFGHEPFFSLDPTDPHDLTGMSLTKRFYPDWLAGTVIGEVMFQADYALKEICFGEHAEALPWLQNVFEDIDESLRNGSDDHAARQWFTLRRVGVIVASDGVVVPRVQIDVETRRLVKGKHGYEDAPFTDPRDPLVKQSAAVSARFNEVAGHLPVVGELLAVSRAMVAAKFLLEHGCRCNKSVLEQYMAPRTPEGSNYALQIPTLSKTRGSSEVVTDSSGLVLRRRRRAMHGGVDLTIPMKKISVKAEPTTRLLGKSERPALLPLFLQPTAASAA